MSALQYIKDSLTFQYEAFNLSAHDMKRIHSTIDLHLREARLTKESSRVPQWVGVTLIRVLIRSLLSIAHEAGTQNWDKTLSDVTSILLCSALTCRVGDIMKGKLDEHRLPFLCWKNIKIKLVKGSLMARIRVRNEKGHN